MLARIVSVLLITSVLGCGVRQDSDDPLQPNVPDLPEELPVAFSSTWTPQSPGLPHFITFHLAGTELTASGRQGSASTPMQYTTTTVTQYGDSLVIYLNYQSGAGAAGDAREFELLTTGVTPRAKWVRVRTCASHSCYLLRDTVLFAPLPGRRPPGWPEQPLLPR